MAASKREELKRRVEEKLDELLALLFSLLRNAPRFRSLWKQAEDIVQEAFLSLFIQIHRGNLDWVLDEPDPLGTISCFLFTTYLKDALGKILERMKDPCSHGYLQIIEMILVIDDPWIPDWLDLERIIAALPEEHRKILHWHYVEGWSLKKVAKELGKTPDAVKQKLYRIRRQLQKRLQLGRDGDTAFKFGVSPFKVRSLQKNKKFCSRKWNSRRSKFFADSNPRVQSWLNGSKPTRQRLDSEGRAP